MWKGQLRAEQNYVMKPSWQNRWPTRDFFGKANTIVLTQNTS